MDKKIDNGLPKVIFIGAIITVIAFLTAFAYALATPPEEPDSTPQMLGL